MLWATYEDDVAEIAERLPSKAREFALAPWHCDANDPRCLHDAWIETVDIKENSSGARHENRKSEISIRLLGAYHDRYLKLRFIDVRRYSMGQHPGRPSVAHGDVLEDAISLAEESYILYSLHLEFGGIQIEAKDIEFLEEPI